MIEKPEEKKPFDKNSGRHEDPPFVDAEELELLKEVHLELGRERRLAAKPATSSPPSSPDKPAKP